MEKNELLEVEEIDGFTLFIKNCVTYINENKPKVFGGIAVFFAALIIASSLPAWFEKKEAASFVELQASLSLLATEKPADAEGLIKVFSPVKTKFKGSKAAGLADLYLARNLVEMGKSEDAVKYYESSKTVLGSHGFLSEIISYELGSVYFDKNKDKAFSYFKDVVSSKGFLEEEALFYLALGNDNESLKEYEKRFPKGFYSEIVKEKVLLKK